MRAIGRNEFVESGRRAGLAGITRDKCPLAIRSKARKWWLEGWRTGWSERHAAKVKGGSNDKTLLLHSG
jgi:ribosome modulation factor